MRAGVSHSRILYRHAGRRAADLREHVHLFALGVIVNEMAGIKK